jgi:hypothetical protein
VNAVSAFELGAASEDEKHELVGEVRAAAAVALDRIAPSGAWGSQSAVGDC